MNSQGRGFLVDEEDFERVAKHSWTFNKKHSKEYLHGFVGNRSVYLHRFILDYVGLLQVDHINGDTSDNRKSNLRLCTASENNQRKKLTAKNFLQKRGVYPSKGKKRITYMARISVSGRTIHLGTFKTVEQASNAYNEAVLKFDLNRILN